MKLILNNQDITPLTGKLAEIGDEVYLSLGFLKKLLAEGIQVSHTDTEFKVEVKPEDLLKLLSKDHSFPAELGVKLESDEDGRINAKAELEFGSFAKASVDQNGKIQAGIKIKF